MRISRNKRNKGINTEETKTLEVTASEIIEVETPEVTVEETKEVKEVNTKRKNTGKTVCRVIVATPSYFVINKNGETITVNKSNSYHRNEEILY